MALPDNDPRVFFAAERTLLAWLRTSLTIMALGFVVARFGLFEELLALEVGAAQTFGHPLVSAALGVAFVLLGAVASLCATVQHRRFIATLPLSDLPGSYSLSFALVLSAVVGVLGLLLAIYLALSSP